MPSPSEVREWRIKSLFYYFLGNPVQTIDPIYHKALEMFPVTEPTAKSYARAVLRMIEAKKKRGE